MKKALKILREKAPDLEIDGEMTADMALNEEYRQTVFPNSQLHGPANLMVAPNLDSAHIAFGLAPRHKQCGDRRAHFTWRQHARPYTVTLCITTPGDEYDSHRGRGCSDLSE